MGRKHNRIGIKIPKEKKPKAPKKVRKLVEKPFCDGTMSNAAFFGMLRSVLRKRTMFWKPITQCKNRQRFKYIGPNKLRKWSYTCECCGGEFDSKGVAVHHKIPAGELRMFEDLPGFVKRLFCDSIDLILLCNKCHEDSHEKIENNKIIDNYGKINV